MATMQSSSHSSMSSSRRKTLSHADLQEFLCDLGSEDNATENGYGNDLDQHSHGPEGTKNREQVEYTDEQRIRDIYKVTTSSPPFVVG